MGFWVPPAHFPPGRWLGATISVAYTMPFSFTRWTPSLRAAPQIGIHRRPLQPEVSRDVQNILKSVCAHLDKRSNASLPLGRPSYACYCYSLRDHSNRLETTGLSSHPKDLEVSLGGSSRRRQNDRQSDTLVAPRQTPMFLPPVAQVGKALCQRALEAKVMRSANGHLKPIIKEKSSGIYICVHTFFKANSAKERCHPAQNLPPQESRQRSTSHNMKSMCAETLPGWGTR